MYNWTLKRKADKTEKKIWRNTGEEFSKINDNKPEMQEAQRINTHKNLKQISISY